MHTLIFINICSFPGQQDTTQTRSSPSPTEPQTDRLRSLQARASEMGEQDLVRSASGSYTLISRISKRPTPAPTEAGDGPSGDEGMSPMMDMDTDANMHSAATMDSVQTPLSELQSEIETLKSRIREIETEKDEERSVLEEQVSSSVWPLF